MNKYISLVQVLVYGFTGFMAINGHTDMAILGITIGLTGSVINNIQSSFVDVKSIYIANRSAFASNEELKALEEHGEVIVVDVEIPNGIVKLH